MRCPLTTDSETRLIQATFSLIYLSYIKALPFISKTEKAVPKSKKQRSAIPSGKPARPHKAGRIADEIAPLLYNIECSLSGT